MRSSRLPSRTRPSAQQSQSSQLQQRDAPAVASDDTSGTNIRVVTRCRGRNEREIKAKSAVVVDTTSGNNSEISVRVGEDMANNKTYTLDRVFGAEADQSMVFDEVVHPVMEDLLNGMNCTIFAYGQTGTGKTYTMTGDESITNDSYAHDAGIIPRVLFRLFNALESKPDYSVSCSFIELYNEELRDLLDPGDGKKVRIFDDTAKKTVTVQGLNDNQITSAVNGIKMLQTGLRKRHVASTKMNDLSSRSHTIFTINVAMDDASSGECLRGKINLVDLAGSENVGKSGAENKRAREAGMINQSLLTLGRVINALVDNSPHIPYRESKLTRLLQDSLGGRTRTCIIATISPALVNIEETLSALEYASRAKNIKNKPQVNSTVAKKNLLKEYAVEMEKLRQDLVATRKKNGIYMDSDHYSAMVADTESQKILVNDQQRKLDTIDVQLKSARELVEDTKLQLKTVNRELETTTKDVGKTMAYLTETGEQLKSTKRVLNERKPVNSSFGRDLMETLDQTINDVHSLVDKIQQKHELELQARGLIQQSSGDITAAADKVQQQMQICSGKQSVMSKELAQRINSLIETEQGKISDASDYVVKSMDSLDQLTAGLKKCTGDSENNIKTMFANVDQVRDDIKSKVRDGLKTLSTSAATICSSIQSEVSLFSSEVQSPLGQMLQSVKDIIDQNQQQQQDKVEQLEQLQKNIKQASEKSGQQYRRQINHLQSLLKQEQQNAMSGRNALMAQLNEFMQQSTQSEQRIESALQRVEPPQIPTFESEIQSMVQHEQSFDPLNHQQLGETLQSLHDKVDEKSKAISTATEQFQRDTQETIDNQVGAVENNIESLDNFLGHVDTTNREHGELVNGQVASVCDKFTHMLGYMRRTLDDMKDGMQFDHENSFNEVWDSTYKQTESAVAQIRESVANLDHLHPESPPPSRKRKFEDDRVPLHELPSTENLPDNVPAIEEKIQPRATRATKRLRK